MTDYSYNAWPSGEPYAWGQAGRTSIYDTVDFHVDIGCGLLKKGRIGVDRYAAPGVDVVVDLEAGRLPFDDNSIHSIITHHCLEHIGDGFIPLIDDCYRVLVQGGLFRIIVPLFPSWSAVSDPDHRRYFMADADGHCTFDSFCGTPGDTPSNCWLASFSVPYTKARFQKLEQDFTPAPPEASRWTHRDDRELRVALRAVK